MAVPSPDVELLALANTVAASESLLEAVAVKADVLGDTMVLGAVGRHPNTPVARRLWLADHADLTVRAETIGSGLLPVDEVLTRRHDPAEAVRVAIAGLPGLGAELHEEYLVDTPAVRTAIAENDELSIEQLRRLMADAEPSVVAAAKAAASSRGMDVTFEDDEFDQAIAALPGGVAGAIPGGPVPVFSGNSGCVVGPNGGAAAAAPAPLDGPAQDALATGELREQLQAAALPELAGNARELTATNGNLIVRAAFARRDDLTDPERQDAMADPAPEVRAAYLGGGSSTEADRQLMAYDPEPRVRAAVAAKIESHPHRVAFATDPSVVVHQGLARQVAALELDVVCLLGRSSERRVRKAVALNRSEPERLDSLIAGELIEWKVTDWESRLAQLVAGEAYLKARELAPEYPVPLAELAKLASTLV